MNYMRMFIELKRTNIGRVVIFAVALTAIVMITFNTGQFAMAQQLTSSLNGQPNQQISIQGQGLGFMYTPCPPINPGTVLRASLEFNVTGTNNGALTGSFNTTNPLQERPSHGIITNGMVTSSGATTLFILYGTSEVPVCAFSPNAVTITGYSGMDVPIRFIAGNGHVVTIVRGSVACNTT
jgi:hypothetical protein